MSEVTLADAEANLRSLIERVEAGDTVDITRAGKRIARLVPVAAPPERKPVDLAALRALTANMPLQSETAADLVRAMRDGDRY